MPAENGADHIREIDRLYRLDFAEVAEVSLRLSGTVVGAGVIWVYTGWLFVWAWPAVYLVLYLGYFLFLRAKLRTARATDVLIAQAVFPVIVASYLWMPVIMIASTDDALSVSGFCIMACVIIFIVRRSEQYLEMTLAEIGVVAIGLLAAAAAILSRYDNPLAWVGLIFAIATLVAFLTQGAFIVRRHRLRADEIVARTSQAQKLEAIGQLAGGVAHDFNNMLTAVLGNLDLIEEVDDPVLRQELLAEARAAAQRGAQVVRQLLIYARQTDGAPRQVQTSSLLGSVEALCRTLVPSSVALSVRPPSERLSVRADEALLMAALLNLIKNGVDAVEGAGEIIVTGAARRLDAPLKCAAGQSLAAGDYVAFSVADTGPGIPDGDMDRVTDPFFTTKAVGKGSGLGLSMVAGFALKSGGGLQITSSPLGAVVTILLPAATPPR